MKGLFLTDEPLKMKKYIFLMALISLIPSLLLSALLSVSGLFEDIGPDFDPRTPAFVLFLLVAVASPIIETLFMSFIIFVLSFFIKSRLPLAILSTIIWACLHSLQSPAWGLVVWWPFFIFSCAYLTWRKMSWCKAMWVTICIHALQNFIPSIALIISLGS
ncbi:MAG: CPBP family glutamic-type intramembrane protease [Planctomycetota bacterium]|jgi:membrane protease YdiL (CAAX protease family)